MSTINVRIFTPEHKYGRRIDVDKDQGVGVFTDEYAEGRKLDLSCHYALRKRGETKTFSTFASLSSAGVVDGDDLELVKTELPWRTEATGSAKPKAAPKKTAARKKTTARRGPRDPGRERLAARRKAKETDDLAETREAVTQGALDAVSQLVAVAHAQVDLMLAVLEKVHAEIGEAIESVKSSKQATTRRGGRRAA